MGGSSSGKIVNERSAMQMSAVYACVRILAEAIASLPSREELLAQIAGAISGVARGLAIALNGVPSGLAQVAKAVADQVNSSVEPVTAPSEASTPTSTRDCSEYKKAAARPVRASTTIIEVMMRQAPSTLTNG